jgi:hypothetical protein
VTRQIRRRGLADALLILLVMGREVCQRDHLLVERKDRRLP